ncbi:hypothetical protein ACSSS7_007455 [Eimeria intestinalis]
MAMKYVAAYLMNVLGGKEAPSSDDVTQTLKAVGADVDPEILKTLISAVEGKAVHEVPMIEPLGHVHTHLFFLHATAGGGGGGSKQQQQKQQQQQQQQQQQKQQVIAAGMEKLQKVPTGGAAGAAPAAAAGGGGGAAAAPAKEEKKEEPEEEEDADMGFSLFD